MKPTFDPKRPMSWSSISSFEYDKEQWWEKYCLHGKCTKELCAVTGDYNFRCPLVATSKEMLFGKALADAIEDGTADTLVPGLLAKLQKKKEHPFKCFFGDIELVGYADAFNEMTFKKLDEVKTGKKAWDRKRVDDHGQLTMYCFMNWIMNKIRPEEVDIELHWVPTQDNNDFSISFVQPIEIKTFKTKRTMNDIMAFGMRIKKVRQEMEMYCLSHA